MTYVLRDFGNYTVTGRVHQVTEGTPKTVNFTRSANYEYDPKGHFSVEHAYVQYFLPELRNNLPPVVLVHGGGMHGSTWETTPDGRPGWLHLLIEKGFEVHVLDNVERGRSGFAPGLWEGDALLRSHEEAWELFRIGARDDFTGKNTFASSKFPIQSFDKFTRMLVPRWVTTSKLHEKALLATLKNTGPAIVICHSQGGEIALDAAYLHPELFAAMICIEPSGMIEDTRNAPSIPTIICAGDYLHVNEFWQSREQNWFSWIESVRTQMAPSVYLASGVDFPHGHTHLPMLDQDNQLCLNVCLDALSNFDLSVGQCDQAV